MNAIGIALIVLIAGFILATVSLLIGILDGDGVLIGLSIFVYISLAVTIGAIRWLLRKYEEPDSGDTLEED